MSTVRRIMQELKNKGSEQTRKTFLRHGATGDMFGVRVADLKIIAKSIKGNQDLACDLYETGNYDAQYLAGLVADGKQMTKKQLESWVKGSTWQMISEYTVPWVACESSHARSLAMKWIKAKKETVASSGWNTYSGIVALTPDDELDLDEIKGLLKHIENEIGSAKNRVKYTMNGFVIAVGSYATPLTKLAKATAKKVGKVDIDMGGTACKVPLATEYIAKIEKAGRLGKKRKTTRC